MPILNPKLLKKTLLIVAILLGAISVSFSQQLIDKSGMVSFFSEAPLENIEASNNKAMGAIDLEKGTIAASMMIKDFEFDKSLMQEHFNENYMESEKYPKAQLTGNIENLTTVDFNRVGRQSAKILGTIDIHGVKKEFATTLFFDITEDAIEVSSEFRIELKDHKVKIPKMLFQNIAEEVEVKAMFNFDRPTP